MAINREIFSPHNHGFQHNSLSFDFARELFNIVLENKNSFMGRAKDYGIMQYTVVPSSKNGRKTYFKSNPNPQHRSKRSKRYKKSGDISNIPYIKEYDIISLALTLELCFFVSRA